MRIVIDLQGMQTGSRLRGIGRYSLALARAMIRNAGDHEILIALNGLFFDTVPSVIEAFRDVLPPENIRLWHAVEPVSSMDPANAWRKSAGELAREAFLASLNPDIVHISSIMEGFGDDAIHSIGLGQAKFRTAITFYDVIPLIQKDVYLTPNPTFVGPYHEKLRHTRNADYFLAISESAKQEAVEHLPVSPDKVVNIGAAVDDIFKPVSISRQSELALRQKFGLDRPFIMYSGATDDRKNHLGLIKAYANLAPELRDRYQLALVGGLPKDHKANFREFIKACGLTDREVIITDRVSDTELVHFYNLCHLYVFPSWHEGFGLPALEAMSCGAAVIGSNTTSIPEVIGRQDALFDPFNTQTISDKITEVLNDEAYRQDLRRHCLERAQLFSWDRSGKIAIEAFESWHAKDGPATKVQEPEVGCPQWLIEGIARLPEKTASENDWRRISQALAYNHPRPTRGSDDKRQLLVDVSELVQRDGKTGVQRVVRSVLFDLLTEPPEGFVVRPVYATKDAFGYRYGHKFLAKFLGKDALAAAPDSAVDFHAGDIFFGLDMQHHVIPAQAMYFQDLRRGGVHVAFFIHDLLPILQREYFPAGTFEDHARWLLTLAQTDQIICPSKTVAEELRQWLEYQHVMRKTPLRIDWAHEGADVDNSVPTFGIPAESSAVFQAMKARPSFLMVGTLEPRKGHQQVLRAFDILWRMPQFDANLIIVGRRGWHTDALMDHLQRHREMRHRLFWLEGISDEYLKRVYNQASCLVAASYGEGFGLPLIEAAQQKIPIIARDLDVFREVAADHAYYFSGKEPAALSEAVLAWLELFKNGRHPKSDDMPWQTWKETTKNLVALLTNSHPSSAQVGSVS